MKGKAATPAQREYNTASVLVYLLHTFPWLYVNHTGVFISAFNLEAQVPHNTFYAWEKP